MLTPIASDVGIHILGRYISDEQYLSNFNIASLPDGMQSFRRCTVRIRIIGDKISGRPQVVDIASLESRVLVDNKTVVIL